MQLRVSFLVFCVWIVAGALCVRATLSEDVNAVRPPSGESWGSFIGRTIIGTALSACFLYAIYTFFKEGSIILPRTPEARDFHNRVYASRQKKA